MSGATIVTSPITNDNNYSNNVRNPKRTAEFSSDYVRDLNDEVDNDESDVDDSVNNPLMKRFKTALTQTNSGVDSKTPTIFGKNKILNLSKEKYGGAVLSPVTEISFNLSDTSLGTPLRPMTICRRRKINDEVTAKPSPSDDYDEEKEEQTPKDQVNNESSSKCDDSENGYEVTNLKTSCVVSNNFDLNAFQRNRAGRRLIMDNNTSTMPTGMDDLTFYEDDSPNEFTYSPTAANTLLMDEDRLLSPEGSPQRFQIVQSTIIDKQHPSQQLQQSRRKILEPSPRLNKPSSMQSGPTAQIMTPSAKSFRIFHSLSSGSMESTMDDEYMELFEMESLDNDCDGNAPSNLNSLISGYIKTTKTSPELMKRPPVRRCLSLTENTSSANRARTSLFEPKTPEILRTVQDRISFLTSNNQSPAMNTTPYSSRMAAERCFKRPEPPSTTVSPVQSKRYKGDFFSASAEKENAGHGLLQDAQVVAPTRHVLRKFVSMNDADILSALSRSSKDPDLIGDLSKPFCLPLMDGRHRDLKSISSHTLANLINGVYNDSVASFKIIDCRYPYEFEGGHIRGAKNLYTQEQIMEEFINSKTDTASVEADGPKRHILIFHCEFSSERGPKLSRFLRNNDREYNTNSYPALHYPEIYLLHGGYKEFFENHSKLCDPIAYRPMLEPSYAEAYRHFRAKSKSWNGDVKGLGGTTSRLKKSRSRLLL